MELLFQEVTVNSNIYNTKIQTAISYLTNLTEYKIYALFSVIYILYVAS